MNTIAKNLSKTLNVSENEAMFVLQKWGQSKADLFNLYKKLEIKHYGAFYWQDGNVAFAPQPQFLLYS